MRILNSKRPRASKGCEPATPSSFRTSTYERSRIASAHTARLIGVALATLASGLVVTVGMTPTASASGPTVQSVVPARLADTRPGYTTIDSLSAGLGRREAGSHTEIQIAGRGNVPVGATAALINLTDVQPSQDNYLTVYPGRCTNTVPVVSSLNSRAFRDTANSVFVQLNASGSVCVYTVSATDFIIDINGYVPPGGSPSSSNPVRLMDTRIGPKYQTVDGQYLGTGRLPNESHTDIQIAGRGSVPHGAAAAIVNLTAVRPSQNTVLAVYPGPCVTTTPDTSNVNALTGADTANNVVVQLGGTGSICVYTVSETDIVVDLNGYVPSDGTPSTIKPARFADTRIGPDYKTVDGDSLGIGQRGEGSYTEVRIAGRGEVPTTATAAVINLTASQPVQDTYLTAFPGPCTNPLPNVSSVNAPAGTDRANNVTVQLGATGTVCVYTVHATDFVLDVNGYAVSPPAYTCPATVTIPTAECQALVALYTNTNGVNWSRDAGWLTPSDPCTWFGITCSDGHVTGIRLQSTGVAGAIPPEIGALTNLNSLTINGSVVVASVDGRDLAQGGVGSDASPPLGNFDYGATITSLPAEIGQLHNLSHLDLAHNKLTWLPREIGNLTNLTSLDLTANTLSSLPGEIGNLVNLENLRLSENLLTTLPPQIGELSQLTHLDLSVNEITHLPAEIGNLNRLEGLYLALNKLTDIPVQINALVNLRELNVDSNRLAAVPPQISNLTNLTLLGMSDNRMAGDLTAVFAPLMAANRLEYLDLDDNRCLTTTNRTLATWLNAHSPGWRSGCR